MSQAPNKSSSTSSRTTSSGTGSSSSSKTEDSNSMVKVISNSLDDLIFQPFHSSNYQSDSTTPMEKALNIKRINSRIETLKITAFSLGILSSFMFLKKFGSNPLLGLVYVPLALDSFRISYNCYIKKYIMTSSKMLVGTLSALGSTVFKVTASALGVSNEIDPLVELEHGIYWPAVFDGSIVRIFIKS